MLHSDVPCRTLGFSLECSVDSDLRTAQGVGQGATEPWHGDLEDAGGLKLSKEWLWCFGANPL